MDQAEGIKPDKPKSKWRQNLSIIGGTIAYMIPLFVLWNKISYPECFGIRITAHGKGGLIESWWYSYLLIQRHEFLDVVLFSYMWIPLVGFIGWLLRKWWQGKSHRKISFFDDQPPPSPPNTPAPS